LDHFLLKQTEVFRYPFHYRHIIIIITCDLLSLLQEIKILDSHLITLIRVSSPLSFGFSIEAWISEALTYSC
jgi:hypothetical protein